MTLNKNSYYSSSIDSLDSQPIDSSSDGDDYSLTSANEQSPEFFKRRQQQKLFFIAKELYSSEEVFVDVLHLLNCDFRSAVAIHLPEEVLNSILKLLPQLQQINEQLLSELKSRIDNWANNQRISGKYFLLYSERIFFQFKQNLLRDIKYYEVFLLQIY